MTEYYLMNRIAKLRFLIGFIFVKLTVYLAIANFKFNWINFHPHTLLLSKQKDDKSDSKTVFELFEKFMAIKSFERRFDDWFTSF